MAMLVPDSVFPEIKLPLVGGGQLSLPEDSAGNWCYLALYRGGW
jgi:hypothetical protein